MTAQITLIKNIWAASLGALGILSVVSCASAAPDTPLPDAAKPWAELSDCFDRSVAVPVSDAEKMAQSCSGNSAAGDPARSGIERANAYFNAASAYNALAQTGTTNALCRGAGACNQIALSLLDQSLASQQDNQVSLTGSAAQIATNRRFIVRRTLERSRALRGVANSGTVNASCGTRTNCLSDAAALLSSLTVDIPPVSEAPEAARLGCEVLDTRWRVNSDLGREREYLYVEDLRRLVRECPAYAASASDRLAEISFERAERIREGLVQADPPPSIEAALGAITDYRSTLGTDRFKLPISRAR